ncbi:unnamed protein product [Clonostachys rosea]|uniref:GDP/GTP exchange factor Sec2 N-terminal domain-containing protein n=1 Tax=Bionectria ochroleuca TaxID=29856 RepID=A0ABY6TZ74_BIOOC|nr:unnamed protein product [Clonostachys rosea]
MNVFHFHMPAPGQAGSSGSLPPGPHFPSLHINGQPEASNPNHNLLEQLEINFRIAEGTASVAGDTSHATFTGSSTNPRTGQQIASSPNTEDIDYVIPSDSVTNPQTATGPIPILLAERTRQSAEGEATTVPGPSRATAPVSASDQAVRTKMENNPSLAMASSVRSGELLENSLSNALGLLVVNTNKMLAFMENASQPSLTHANKAFSTLGSVQASYDAHAAGESSAENDRCQDCMELRKRITHLEEDHNIEQESKWAMEKNLTKMIKDVHLQTKERICHLEVSLGNFSDDVQRLSEEVEKYKTKATFLQDKLTAIREAMLREDEDSLSLTTTY